MEKFLIGLVAFLLAIPVSILSAFVVSQHWGWFVTPAFGLEVPSIAILIGLSWMVSLFRLSFSSYHILDKLDSAHPDDSDKLRPLVTMVSATLMILFSWLGGWIIHLFV